MSVAGDTLRAFFAELMVEVSGRLPVVGRVHVPVYVTELSASQQAEIAFAHQISEEHLILRGESITAGVTLNDLGAEATPTLGTLATEALSAVGEVLVTAFQGSDLNTYTFLRQ